MKLVTAICVAALAVPPVARSQTEAASTTAANPLPPVDRDFVQAASMSSSTEIDAAKLAARNTSNPDVRAFARKMILDHTKLTVQLKIAAPHGVRVPKDNSDTAVLNALRPLKDRAFDQAYARTVGLDGHRQAIAAFQKEITDGENNALQDVAQQALPVINEHYRMAQALAMKVGVPSQ